MAPRAKPATRDHVAAAKQLLAELDGHTRAIADGIGRTDGAQVLAAVEQRGRLLAQLDDVTHEMARAGSWQRPTDQPAFDDLLNAASAALHSQDQLFRRARGERDRLSAALGRNVRPDAIADQYGATSGAGRRTISVAV